MAGKQISVTLSKPMIELFDACLATGLYGDNRADVARHFIRRGIEESGALRYLPTARKEPPHAD